MESLKNILTAQLGHIILQQLGDRSMVVLPGFGGFVKDHVGAELNTMRNRIHPPKNTVIFNSNLKHNDGMMVAAIALQLRLNYAEADVWLTDAISELRFRLSNGESIDWEGLGSLRRSVSWNIEFVAVVKPAVQDDFFGLKPVSLTAVELDNVGRVRQLVAADGPLATKMRTLPIKRIASYATAAMAVGFLAWLPMQHGTFDKGKLVVHQLNLFGMNTQASYVPRSFDENWIAKGFEREDAFSAKYEQEYLTLQLSEGGWNPIVVKTDAIPTTEVKLGTEVALSVDANASSFNVIAATFATRVKADEYLAKMISRGFNAVYAGKDASGHLVAYGSYTSMEDATKMLASVSLSNKEARIASGN